MTAPHEKARQHARQKLINRIDQMFVENNALKLLEIGESTAVFSTMSPDFNTEFEHDGKTRIDVTFENGAEIALYTKKATEKETSNDGDS